MALLDAPDWERLRVFKWSTIRTRAGKVYAYGCVNGKSALMHRVILGCSSAEQVDHKNGDGLNNRRENLRRCSNTQNSMNRKKRGDTSNPYKGIKRRVNVTCERWEAIITIEGRRRYLGSFITPEEAARAYDAAALANFGEFALVNF